jgi:mannose/fructose/N-acetylgalactosamine-specific phosphotransferase system component IIB
MSWLLQRVDDRLIHGQVLVAWGVRLNPERIWVVDDATAASAWERELMSSAAPDIEVHVVPVADMLAAWAVEESAPGGAFLLVRDLRTALALVEAGAPVTRLNLGGLHYAPGKTKVNEYIYLDDADRARARALQARGVALEVQDVPSARPAPLVSLDPACAPT